MEPPDHQPAHPGIEKLHALTGLRFLAAAMIVMAHSRASFAFPHRIADGLQLQTGVSFFFVLSGFILTHVYPDLRGPGAIKRFFGARFARIWPAHVFTFAIALALTLHPWMREASYPLRPLVRLANLSLVHSWVPIEAWFFSYNAVSWSISTEAFFYLLFPFLIVNLDRTWWWKLALGLGAVGALVAACNYWQIPEFSPAKPFEVNRAGLLYISPLARTAEFILGMTGACFWRRWRNRVSWSFGVATLLEGFTVAACVASIAAFSSIPDLSTHLDRGFATYLVHSGTAPAFALLIIVFACHRGALSAFFATPGLVLLGEISFSTYLLHKKILECLFPWRDRLPQSLLGGVLAYAAFWVILLVLSWLVWRWIERPSRLFLLRLSGTSKSAVRPLMAPAAAAGEPV